MKRRVRLKRLYTLLRKDMRDDSAFASMFGARACVEYAGPDGDECVIKIGFERPIAVCVDDLESFGIVDGDVIRSDSDKFPCG